jgi:sigma-E factor negative regulatory protein RseA
MHDDPTLNAPESQLASQLSAFLDGELPRTEADLFIRRLERDAGLKRALSRYALIGEVMRTPASGSGAIVSGGFVSRVSAALATEAPHGATSAVPADRNAPAATSRWLKPLAGLSIAAGVAALTIGLLTKTPEAVQSVATVADQSEAATDPAVLEASYIVPEITVTGPLLPAARLTNYVMAHSEYSSPLGRRNVLSSMLADESTSPDGAIPAGFVPDQEPGRLSKP